ncbi:MAG: polysaccharide biosynthesis/export family protein [Planctomycetota bacterium]|nr:polysaccharide biosynthesis/export family protein [Planctomycetota bacterium]
MQPQASALTRTMPSPINRNQDGTPDCRWTMGKEFVLLAVLLNCLFSGCAALTNPVLNGIPVRRCPTELLAGPRREALRTIPLSLLSQRQPQDYTLASGDVLGVFIPGIFPLADPDQPIPSPPVYFPSQIDPVGAGLPPALGYPIVIRVNGSIALPLVDPIRVEGLTVEQANEAVRKAYLEKGLLQPGREAIMVSLMEPRQVRVLVFRQEVGGFAAGGRGDIAVSNQKQGTANIVNLKAYENDVLNALAQTG